MREYYSFLSASAGSLATDLIAGYIVAITERNSDKIVIVMTSGICIPADSYTHLRAHETDTDLVCRLLLEKNFF